MYRFGRLIELAHAEPVALAKYGQPVVVVLAVTGYERLRSLDTPSHPCKGGTASRQ